MDGRAGSTILYQSLLSLFSPRQLPRPITISDDYWPDGDAGAWAPPPHPPGPQDLLRDYGPDGAAGGLSRSTPLQADDTTTRPSGSGPTRQSDVRDSEPDYLLRPTRHGQGGTMSYYSLFLFRRRSLNIRLATKHSMDIAETPSSQEVDVTFESAIKEAAAFAASSAITHIPCSVCFR